MFLSMIVLNMYAKAEEEDLNGKEKKRQLGRRILSLITIIKS